MKKIAEFLRYAEIKMVDNGSEIIVTGPYLEMKDVFPKLKPLGFKYNSSDRSWRYPSSKITPVKKEKIMEVVDVDKRNESVAKQKEKQYEKNLKIVKNIPYDFHIDEYYKKLEFPRENDYEFLKDLYSLGGRKNDVGIYSFDLTTTPESTLIELSEIIKKIKEKEELQRQADQEKFEYATQKLHNKSFIHNNIRTEVKKGSLEIWTSDKKYKDLIADAFVDRKWDGREWVVKFQYYTRKQLRSAIDKFLDLCEEWQKKHDVEKQEHIEYMKDKIVLNWGSGYHGRMQLTHGDIIKNPKQGDPEYLYVLKFESKYFAEDGLSFGVGDDRGYTYTIITRAATDEEAAELKQHHQTIRNKQQVMQDLENIKKYIQKDGHFPKKGTIDYYPKGKILYFNRSHEIYGGGERIIISSDKIWFLQGRSADGDAWESNNIMGTDLGWYVNYNKELADKIIELGNIAQVEMSK